MREYLFHGKRVDNGEWVEGYYVKAEKLDKSGYEHFIIEEGADGASHLVYPESVGEWTGMNDKNGRKIFEGDIVHIDADVKEMFNICDGVVKYGWGGFHIGNFAHLSSLHAIAAYDCVLRGKVIGTVFENADLLGG